MTIHDCIVYSVPTPWICQPHGVLICSVPHSWGLGCVGSLVVAPSSGTAARGLAHLTEHACDAGKYTVPVLWDKKTSKIVNNESSEIIRIFNAEFNDLAKNPDLDLYPEALRGEIDAVNEWTYPCINNGVYRAGFAQAQAAYESAFNDVFSGLDRVEAILAERRYLAGDVLTEADIRLFMTLIRFDPVYVVYFKCNKRFISQYPNIREYTKELYQTDGIKRSVNMYHIKVLPLDLPSVLPMLTGHRRVLNVDRTLQSVTARLIHCAVHVQSSLTKERWHCRPTTSLHIQRSTRMPSSLLAAIRGGKSPTTETRCTLSSSSGRLCTLRWKRPPTHEHKLRAHLPRRPH